MTSPSSSTWIERYLKSIPNQRSVYDEKVRLAAGESGLSGAEIETSPTLAAFRALSSMFEGRIDRARIHEAELYRTAKTTDQGTFFQFPWSYNPGWPYNLKAPWVSSLPQGLALSYHCMSARRTGRAQDAAAARSIAKAFRSDIRAGGYRRDCAVGVFFDEYPMEIETWVFNGAAIATLALLDFASQFNDPVAKNLAERAGDWFGSNIARYDVISPLFAGPVSAYSLAPARGDVLFRFVGTGSAKIGTVESASGTSRGVVLEIGNPTDDFRGQDAFVWSDTEYMNWGPRSLSGVHACRAVRPAQGRYNHAPFTLALPLLDGRGPHSIKARYWDLEGALQLQVYDGTVYHLVADLSGLAQDGVLDRLVPDDAIRTFAASLNRTPPVDASYFADNFHLARLLAEAFDNARIRDVAARWKGSLSRNHGTLDPTATLQVLSDRSTRPAIAVGEAAESVHVEYPTVVEACGRWTLIYGAYGDDKCWRLMWADRTLGERGWRRRGVLNIEGEPFGKPTNVCFPCLALDEPRGRWVLAYSADLDGDGRYDSMHLAESYDLLNWKWVAQINALGGLAMDLSSTMHGLSLIFTIVEGASGYFLIETSSNDGTSWSAGETLYALRSRGDDGFYTWTRFNADDVEYFIGELQLTSDRNVWRLFKRDGNGRLSDCGLPDLWRGRKSGRDWNAHRYGMIVRKLGDQWVCFYNGISLAEGEGNGQIGEANFEIEAVRSAFVAIANPVSPTV